MSIRQSSIILTSIMAMLGSGAAFAIDVSSPDSQVRFSIDAATGMPAYKVRYRGQQVIAGSRLGLRFAGDAELPSDVQIHALGRRSQDESWEQPWGERRYIKDRYNELLVRLSAASGVIRHFDLRVRVYDDGIGFRYEIPEQGGVSTFDIVDEVTEFSLPANAVAFWQPGDHRDKYEVLYRTTALSEIDNAHTPLTVRLPSGVHLSLHEAALVDYSAYTLAQRAPGVLRTVLRPWSDGMRVRGAAPMHSPWRSIQISPDARGLLNSNLILNLNEPNVLGDVSWVEPGKYTGIWWAMHLGRRTWHTGPQHGASTEAAREQIDFAAKHRFDGVLVEGWNVGWGENEEHSYTEATADFDLPDVANYARQSNVRLIGHHETFGDIPRYEDQLADALDLYASLDVKQVKTGYVGPAGSLQRIAADGSLRREWHDSQYAVDHHLRVVKAAAVRQISINTHEPVKDTGLRRTYPNWLSREGARGQEFDVWGETPNPPEHAVLLAFTRLLAGPMDFTPGVFNLELSVRDTTRRVQTTLAKQLALYVVLYSPVQMVPDLPEHYARYPDAFQFIVDVPTDWENSVGLAGEVGDYVVFARRERGGDDWFLGAISDELSRDLRIPTDFLADDRRYIATIYRDGDKADWQSNPYDLVIEERIFDRNDMLELKLAAGGGAAIRFRPEQEAQQ